MRRIARYTHHRIVTDLRTFCNEYLHICVCTVRVRFVLIRYTQNRMLYCTQELLYTVLSHKNSSPVNRSGSDLPAGVTLHLSAGGVTLHLSAGVTFHLLAGVTLHLSAGVTLHLSAAVTLHLSAGGSNSPPVSWSNSPPVSRSISPSVSSSNSPPVSWGE